MKPTEILSNEHRVIEIVLTCLEKIAAAAEKDGRLDRESAEQAIDFIRNFADRCHHGKEENHLFTALGEAGLPRSGGPVAQMLSEHDHGRAFVRGMAAAIDEASEGSADALDSFVDCARGYIHLLRAHIVKEDQVLFPIADRVLTADKQGELMVAFESVESDHMGAGTHDKYLRLVETLAKRYGVSFGNVPTKSCGCSQ